MKKFSSFRDAVDRYAYWDGSPLTGREAELNKPDPAQRARKESRQPTDLSGSEQLEAGSEQFGEEQDGDTTSPKPQSPPDMGANKAAGQPRAASKQPKPAPMELSLQQQYEEIAAEEEADEAEARWESLPEHQSNIDDDALHEAETRKFGDAVREKIKEIQSPKKAETQVPPIEPAAWDPELESRNPRGYASELQTKGEQLGEDNFLATAGVYEASPEQLQQFAQMLGLEMWGVINTPEQLTGAMEYAGAQARERLNQILRHNGLMASKRSEPEQKTLSEQAGKALGDFAGGMRDGTGIGLARKMLGAAGRPIGRAIASEVTRSRNQAGDKYQGEYPGYQPAQVNVIPPPKAPGPGPMFTAKTNHPDADFWIARRGSSKTVGKPHREFAPESIGITVNREHLDPDYAYYLMEHLHQKGHWAERATGTTNLVNINNKHIKELQGMMQPAPQEPGPPVEGPIPPLPKEKPAEQSYGEKEVENIKESYSAFNEADHPRDDSGKFKEGSSGNSSSLKPGDKITTKRKMTYANPGYTQSDKEMQREVETVEPGKNPDKCKVKFVGSKTKYTYNKKTGLLRALNDQMTEHRIVEEEQPGIVMPTDDVDNDDASDGDQLGLFGEGKKKKVPKQYKQENPQGKARVKSLFDKDEDPDQQTLFSSFGEAVSYYSAKR